MTLLPFRDMPDANVWRRLAAALYDGFLLGALWFASVGAAVIAHRGEAIPPHLMQGVGLPLLWLETAAFYAWFWLHGGQTLGMRSWRLRLVTVDGRPLRWRDCLMRSLVGTLSWLAIGAGYVWAAFTGRTWHDTASRTRVVLLPKDAA